MVQNVDISSPGSFSLSSVGATPVIHVEGVQCQDEVRPGEEDECCKEPKARCRNSKCVQ